MTYKAPIMSELVAEGKSPEVVFWVGCAGSFDQRAQRVTTSNAGTTKCSNAQ